MELTALGYIGLGASSGADWRDFACGQLGMMRVDRGGRTEAFRMDDRRQRLIVTEDGRDGLGYLGWEAPDAAALDRLAARLDAHDVAVEAGSAALAAERQVAGLIVFHDPLGNRLEAFHGPKVADEPFVPGRPVSGFKTGALGMGHAVLHAKDADAVMPFYRDVLGFRISDYARAPITFYFFHVNRRHHSFAILGTGLEGFHHFMVEMTSLDDVGQGYDLAQEHEDRVAYTLGRHTNDWMTSFYAKTPSGFFVETGWGGREIEPEGWEAEQMHYGPSFWGHDRPYLPDEQRARFREMRMRAAEDGVRAPSGGAPYCAWLDGLREGRG